MRPYWTQATELCARSLRLLEAGTSGDEEMFLAKMVAFLLENNTGGVGFDKRRRGRLSTSNLILSVLFLVAVPKY